MVRAGRYVGAVASLFLLAACQALAPPRAPVPFPDALQVRAQALEDRGDIVGAIRYWEAAAGVAEERLSVLQALRGARIEAEMAAAEQAFAKGEADLGVTHLLKVLRMEPAHEKAQQRLQGTLSRSLVVPYTVRGGESAVTIAGRVYKNVRLASLIEALYGRKIPSGTVLWLPSVEASLVAAQFSYGQSIAKARRLYRQKRWGALLAASEEILSYAPGDKEALYLKNTAAHSLAEDLFRQERYREALALYRRVDAYFKNEKPRIKEILSIQKRQRDDTRARKNARLMEEATLLARKGALVASRNVLRTVDEGVAGRSELAQTLTKRLNRKAEVHYRKGVRLFLEENLTGAIAEWEKSLDLNPDHVKAFEGVVNAGHLLDKVNGLQPEKGENKP